MPRMNANTREFPRPAFAFIRVHLRLIGFLAFGCGYRPRQEGGNMRIGLFLGASAAPGDALDKLVARVQQAEQDGFS